MSAKEIEIQALALKTFLDNAYYDGNRCNDCGIIEFITTDACPNCGIVYKEDKDIRKDHQIHVFGKYLEFAENKLSRLFY